MKTPLDVPQLPYIAQFLRSEATRKRPSTIRNHTMALCRFARWLSTRNGTTAVTIVPLELDEYACDLAQGCRADQRNWHISALRVYLRWLYEVGLRPDNPGQVLHFCSPEPVPIQSLSAEEVGLLLRFIARSARLRFGTARTAYLLPFLCETGLRIGEALGLTMADLDLDKARLLVRAPKTRSVHTLPITTALGRLLEAYLARREGHLAPRGLAGPDCLFCAEHGGRWSRSSAEQSCRTVAKLAGITRRFYPHLARHTFATLSLVNGAPLAAIMAVGGWRRLSTVQRYVQMSDDQLAEVAQASSPLAHAQKVLQ